MARLLVVDGSKLMAWALASVVPKGMEVELVGTFEDAESRLRTDAPDYAIFTIPPWDPGWRRLVDLCSRHDPPVPCLCWTQVDPDHFSVCCGGALGSLSLQQKPCSLGDLRSRVAEFLDGLGVDTSPRP